MPGIAFVVGLLFVVYLGLVRVWPLRRLRGSQPAANYDEAVVRLHTLQASEALGVNPLCRTQLLTHGQRTPRVIVFLHGFTNCPHQFHQLAAHFHARGYNVLNTRLPAHGMADPLTPALAGLSAAEMVNLTNEAIDIALGLGEEVTLLGFSLGGILAAWAAQQRADLHRAVLVSPAVGLTPPALQRSRLVANALTVLPNFFQWWDPVAKAARSGPAHAYPRFASRGLAALLHLANLVRQQAARAKPAAQTIQVITNANDPLIDRPVVAQVVAQWQRHGASVQTYEFPADWHLIHDLMDPAQPEQQVERVYPQLLTWIEGAQVPASVSLPTSE